MSQFFASADQSNVYPSARESTEGKAGGGGGESGLQLQAEGMKGAGRQGVTDQISQLQGGIEESYGYRAERTERWLQEDL